MPDVSLLYYIGSREYDSVVSSGDRYKSRCEDVKEKFSVNFNIKVGTTDKHYGSPCFIITLEGETGALESALRSLVLRGIESPSFLSASDYKLVDRAFKGTPLRRLRSLGPLKPVRQIKQKL